MSHCFLYEFQKEDCVLRWADNLEPGLSPKITASTIHGAESSQTRAKQSTPEPHWNQRNFLLPCHFTMGGLLDAVAECWHSYMEQRCGYWHPMENSNDFSYLQLFRCGATTPGGWTHSSATSSYSRDLHQLCFLFLITCSSEEPKAGHICDLWSMKEWLGLEQCGI